MAQSITISGLDLTWRTFDRDLNRWPWLGNLINEAVRNQFGNGGRGTFKDTSYSRDDPVGPANIISSLRVSGMPHRILNAYANTPRTSPARLGEEQQWKRPESLDPVNSKSISNGIKIFKTMTDDPSSLPVSSAESSTPYLVRALVANFQGHQRSKIRRNFLLAAMSLRSWLAGISDDSMSMPPELKEIVLGTSDWSGWSCLFKDSGKRDMSLFLAVTISPLILLDNKVWGSTRDNPRQVAAMKWHEFVEPRKPAMLREIEHKLFLVIDHLARDILRMENFDERVREALEEEDGGECWRVLKEYPFFRPSATPNQSPLQDISKRPGPVEGTSEDLSISTCEGSSEGSAMTLIGEQSTSREGAQSSTYAADLTTKFTGKQIEEAKERASLDPELEERMMGEVLKDFERRIEDKKRETQAKWDLLKQENELMLREMKRAEAVAQKESEQRRTVFREQAEQAEREAQERIRAAKGIVPSTKRKRDRKDEGGKGQDSSEGLTAKRTRDGGSHSRAQSSLISNVIQQWDDTVLVLPEGTMKDVAEVEDIDWRSLFTFTTSAIRFDGTRTDVRFHFLRKDDFRMWKRTHRISGEYFQERNDTEWEWLDEGEPINFAHIGWVSAHTGASEAYPNFAAAVSAEVNMIGPRMVESQFAVKCVRRWEDAYTKMSIEDLIDESQNPIETRLAVLFPPLPTWCENGLARNMDTIAVMQKFKDAFEVDFATGCYLSPERWWCVANTANTHERRQIACCGAVTAMRVMNRSGALYVGIEAESDVYHRWNMNPRKYAREDQTEPTAFDYLNVEPGLDLIIAPNTRYMSYSAHNTVTIGKSFYSAHLMTRTLSGIVQQFLASWKAVKYSLATEFRLVFQMVNFWHMLYDTHYFLTRTREEVRLLTLQEAWDHTPDVSTVDGLMNMMATWALVELSTILNVDLYGPGLEDIFLEHVGPARKVARYLILRISQRYGVRVRWATGNEIMRRTFTVIEFAEIYLLDLAASIYDGVRTMERKGSLAYLFATDGDYWNWVKSVSQERIEELSREISHDTYPNILPHTLQDKEHEPGRPPLPLNTKLMKEVLDRHFQLPIFSNRLDSAWHSIAGRNVKDEFIGMPRDVYERVSVFRLDTPSVDAISLENIPAATYNDFVRPASTISKAVRERLQGEWGDYMGTQQAVYYDFIQRE